MNERSQLHVRIIGFESEVIASVVRSACSHVVAKCCGVEISCRLEAGVVSVVGERGAVLVLGDALCRPQHSQSNGAISVPPLRCVVPLKCGDGTNSTRVSRVALSALRKRD